MSADHPRIRAVFDCMVYLQGAARRESAAGACLLLVELRAVELYLSKEILAEIRDVLTRPRMQLKFPILSRQYVNQFLAALEKRADDPERHRAFRAEAVCGKRGGHGPAVGNAVACG